MPIPDSKINRYVSLSRRAQDPASSKTERKVANKLMRQMEKDYPGIAHAARDVRLREEGHTTGAGTTSGHPAYQSLRKNLHRRGVDLPGWADLAADVVGDFVREAQATFSFTRWARETTALQAKNLSDGRVAVRAVIGEEQLDAVLMQIRSLGDLERYCEAVGQLVADELLLHLTEEIEEAN